MGKKLAALLGKSFKTSKFRILATSAVSRIAYLEKQHKTRCFQARSDVVQLLNVGQIERALLRVEHVIREQNMLDAYAIIENYCYLLMERVMILEENKKCPDELKEAISSLIFAASRCGELPEMQKMRGMFESRFGKEFALRAVELRNNSGVNPKIAKKLAIRQPSLNSKLKALNEIAPGSLQLERKASRVSEKLDVKKKAKYIQSASSDNPDIQEDVQDIDTKLEQDNNLFENETKKYEDLGTAAGAAFLFAEHAVAAAKAVVELSRSCENPDSQISSSQGRYAFNFDEYMVSELHIDEDAAPMKSMKNLWNDGLDSDSIQADGTLRSKAKNERITDNKNAGHLTESEEINKKEETKRVFVESDDDSRRKQEEIVLITRGKSSLGMTERLRSRKPDEDTDRDASDNNKDETEFQVFNDNQPKQTNPVAGLSRLECEHQDFTEQIISGNLKVGRRPLSMRTKRMHRQ